MEEEKEIIETFEKLYTVAGRKVSDAKNASAILDILEDLTPIEIGLLTACLERIAVAEQERINLGLFDTAKKVVSQKWLNGTNYKEHFKATVGRTMESIKKAAEEKKDIAEAFVKSKTNQAKDIIVTEITRVINQVRLLLNVDRYRYVSRLDRKTCGDCLDLHDKIFRKKDLKIGINCPPIHTYCRCRLEPVRSG